MGNSLPQELGVEASSLDVFGGTAQILDTGALETSTQRALGGRLLEGGRGRGIRTMIMPWAFAVVDCRAYI